MLHFGTTWSAACVGHIDLSDGFCLQRNATAEVEHARDLRVEIEQLRANAAELEQAHEDAISEIADQLRQAEQDFESVKSQLSASYDARETMESQLVHVGQGWKDMSLI